MVVLEQGIVGLKEDVGSVFFVGGAGLVADQFSTFEHGLAHLSVAGTPGHETAAQCIDRLGSHSVQTDTFLEGLGIVFTSGVQHGNGIDQTSQRNASSIVAHGHPQVVFHLDFNAFSGSHLELVDTVVDDFFQQHINSVFHLRAVAQATDVHTGTGTYVLHVAQVANVLFGISYRGNGLFIEFFHIYSPSVF